MKLSTILKTLGIFAVAMSGKALPEAKADFIPNVTVCNNFNEEDNTVITFGQLAVMPVVPSQTCKTFSTEENFKPFSYTEKYGVFGVTNKWGTSSLGALHLFLDGTKRLSTGDIYNDGCVFAESDNTFITAPAVNFTCTAPKLRN